LVTVFRTILSKFSPLQDVLEALETFQRLISNPLLEAPAPGVLRVVLARIAFFACRPELKSHYWKAARLNVDRGREASWLDFSSFPGTCLTIYMSLSGVCRRYHIIEVHHKRNGTGILNPSKQHHTIDLAWEQQCIGAS
jgi:hypothetical protein